MDNMLGRIKNNEGRNMDTNNRGILVADPRPADYILGGQSSISTVRAVKNWAMYMPEKEAQHNKVTDFLACVTFSGCHSIEMQLNYLMATNQLSDEALSFFHNNNYIKDGSFDISERFNAQRNGTDKTKGQYLNIAGDHFRIDGFVPDSLWPTTPEMTWDEFYKTPPQSVIDMGKKALWYINLQYQWTPRPDLDGALNVAPVQVATEICKGWSDGEIIDKCSGQPLQHATLLYQKDIHGTYFIIDQYDPFLKRFAPDYELPLNMQYMVTMKPITLRKGMYGENVLKLQQDLKAIGYPISCDKFYGPMTEIKVILFQKNNGLFADGIAGPKTLSKIEELKSNKYSLLPMVNRMADELIKKCASAGYSIKIVSGYRTKDEQDKLYQQGRSMPGAIVTNVQYPKSLHCHGLAFDICFIGSVPYPTDDTKWKAIADIGQSIGLTAGFYFPSFKDIPHFEFKGQHSYQQIYDFKYKKEYFY